MIEQDLRWWLAICSLGSLRAASERFTCIQAGLGVLIKWVVQGYGELLRTHVDMSALVYAEMRTLSKSRMNRHRENMNTHFSQY